MASWLFSWNVARLGCAGSLATSGEEGEKQEVPSQTLHPSFFLLVPEENPGAGVPQQELHPHPWRIHPAGTLVLSRAIPEVRVEPGSQPPDPEVSWSEGLQKGLDLKLCCCSKSHFSLLPARQGGEAVEPVFPVAALLTPIISG